MRKKIAAGLIAASLVGCSGEDREASVAKELLQDVYESEWNLNREGKCDIVETQERMDETEKYLEKLMKDQYKRRDYVTENNDILLNEKTANNLTKARYRKALLKERLDDYAQHMDKEDACASIPFHKIIDARRAEIEKNLTGDEKQAALEELERDIALRKKYTFLNTDYQSNDQMK
jgi:hypothetical protein